MKHHLLKSTAVALVVGACSLNVTTAFAQQSCVRVLGYESDGEKQTMDPAALIGTDSAYHIRAVYEPLVDRSNTMTPVPVLAEIMGVKCRCDRMDVPSAKGRQVP